MSNVSVIYFSTYLHIRTQASMNNNDFSALRYDVWYILYDAQIVNNVWPLFILRYLRCAHSLRIFFQTKVNCL